MGPGAVGQIGSCLLPIATSGGSQLWIAMPLVDWAHNFGHEGLTSILTASGLIDVVTENSENRGLLNAGQLLGDSFWSHCSF